MQCYCAHSDCVKNLDNQSQVDSKSAGQPEQASLNQCQLIAANSPKLVLCALPSWWRISGSNPYESPDWSLFPRDLFLTPNLCLLACVLLFTIAHIVIGLSLLIHSFLHPRQNPFHVIIVYRLNMDIRRFVAYKLHTRCSSYFCILFLSSVFVSLRYSYI